jgi:IS30 family transposase
MNNKDISRAERLEIGILVEKGYSLRAIARVLKRSPNTISYEIRRNSVNGKYDPVKAHNKARFRKRMRRLQWSKISESPELEKFVIEKLICHWNPDEIAGYLKRNKSRYPWYISKTAIYKWLKTVRGERYDVHLYSRRKGRRRKKSKSKRVVIPNRVDITRRFLGADNRSRYGHWEDDSIISKRGTRGGAKVAYERKARFIVARKVESMKPEEHAEVERDIFSHVKTRSITRDNGFENRFHERVGIPSFFCRSYSAWQKGGVENANKMIRRYLPKGTDFDSVSQEDLDYIVSIINGKPRKILGYRSALEVARAAGIIKDEVS